MNTPKLCKDCKHAKHYHAIPLPFGFIPEQWYCLKSPYVDLVSGVETPMSCESRRDDQMGGSCGREAKDFEPKEVK